MPPPPNPGRPAAAPATRPTELKIAFGFWVAYLVLLLLGLSAVSSITWVALVPIVAVLAFVVIQMRAGRNWARITLTVLSVLYVLRVIVNASLKGLAAARLVGGGVCEHERRKRDEKGMAVLWTAVLHGRWRSVGPPEPSCGRRL